jgi:hypothetical protein
MRTTLRSLRASGKLRWQRESKMRGRYFESAFEAPFDAKSDWRNQL